MSGPVSFFAAMALVPAMLGGAAPEHESSLMLALCGGGVLTIQIPGKEPPPPGSGECPQKGCHSGCTRKRIDRAQ